MSISPRIYYGESIFTSFRSYNGKVPGLNLHFKRLFEGVERYYLPEKLNLEDLISHFDLKGKVENLLKGEDLYMRIVIFSKDRDIMHPESFSLDDLQCEIESRTVSNISKKDLRLLVTHSPFSRHYRPMKSESYMPIFAEKRKAISMGFDDILFNAEGELTESSTSSFIFLEGGVFYTSNSKTILESVTLNLFKAFCYKKKYQLKIEKIDAIRIPRFESAFLLNSVQGIVTVGEINQNESTQLLKTHNVSEEFLEYLKGS